jgi:hypothetical protein
MWEWFSLPAKKYFSFLYMTLQQYLLDGVEPWKPPTRECSMASNRLSAASVQAFSYRS